MCSPVRGGPCGPCTSPPLACVRRRWKRPGNAAVLRVAQLDAGRLDVELASMLQEQLRRAFSLFRPVRDAPPAAACIVCSAPGLLWAGADARFRLLQELISMLEPELKLLLDLLVSSGAVPLRI
jgi:hypothetical protein